MEDTAIFNCNFDNDSPLYVGQGPMLAELDDDDVRSSTAVDGQVLSEDDDGCNMQEHCELGQDGEQEASCPKSNLVLSEKQSGDHPSVDPQQNMESCQALKNDSFDTENTDSFDWTRDSGCTKVDENGDDDDDDDVEICVGHEGENTESSLRNEALRCQSTGDCEISLFADSSKVECSSPGTAETRNVDNKSSTSNVTQSKHLSRCETLSGEDLDRTCDEDAIKYNKLEDSSFLDIRNCETPNSQEHQRPSDGELPTTSNFSKDETGESQTYDTVNVCPAIESYSLRTRRKRASSQEDSLKSKPKTPSKKSAMAGFKDPKIKCKEGQKDKEGKTLAVPRRTSPRKKNRIDHDLGEDQPKSNMTFSVCDENLNSKMIDEEVRNDSLQAKERRSALKSESCCIESLEDNSVFDVDDDDCEPVSSQIITGAPMFSGSKTRKRSLRGKGSSCLTSEDVSGAGEGMQVNANDALKVTVEPTIPEPELDHEGEKQISNEDQSNNFILKQACVEEISPCHDVLKISNKQRRRQEQSEITVISNEHMDTDHQKEEKTLKRTQKGSKICEQSKKLKCLGNKIDVMDDQNNLSTNASVEIPLQTVHEVRNGGSCTENKEAPENIENVDGPTPPEKRPIRRARRGRPRARKSASALIDILTAASASALKRVSDSVASQPSSKENQESILQTEQMVASKKKKRASSRKGKVPKAPPQSRKRKFPGGSPGGDDSVKSGKVVSCGRQADEPSNLTADSSPGQNAAMLRLECVSHDEGSGDDDDELMNPVLTPDSKMKDLPPAFNVGEVVWAQDSKDKSRWPAVVIEVAGENVSRRVYNVFKTNETKEQFFQVKSSRYLKQYNCREKETYLEKGKHVTEFNTAVERANDFIMKIGLGKVNSYEDFFKPNDAYFDSPPPSPHSTSPPSPALVVGHSSPEYPPHRPKINQPVDDDNNDDDDDDEEEKEEDESLNESQNSLKNSCNGNSKDITRLKRKWQRKEKRLLEHMRSEQTKEYLFGIQHGTVPSVRHQWFLSSNANDKGRLKWGSCGALISEKKRMDIMDYLKNLLTRDKSPLSSTRYMMDVALPEALNFAYQKVHRVSKDEAERVIPMDGQQVIRDLDIG